MIEFEKIGGFGSSEKYGRISFPKPEILFPIICFDHVKIC
jgi:hypothetical protein